MEKTLVETQTGTANGREYAIHVWKLADHYEIEAVDSDAKPLPGAALQIPLQQIHGDPSRPRYDLLNDALDSVENLARAALGETSVKS